MDNVVEIVVRSKNETKVGFDSARVDASTLGDQVGETFSQRFANRIINLRARIKTSIDKSGSDIGDSFGESIHKRITERLKVAFSGGRQKVDVDVDVDEHKQSFLSRMTGLGKEGGDKLSDGIGGSLTSFFSGDLLSLLAKAVGGTALVAILAPAIGAALSAAILLALGGGVIGAGIVSAFRDPRILGAAGDLKTKLVRMFDEFGKPFRGPVADFLEKFSHFLDTSAPNIQKLADAFAPLVGALGTGFIALLQNALPGITDAALAAQPIFDTLAAHMPAIGQALGDFFRDIGEHGPEAAQFFGDLLSAIEFIIPALGELIGWLASFYLKAREVALTVASVFVTAFGIILQAADDAFGWIPGLGPKIDKAKTRFTGFAAHINDSLAAMHDKTIHVTVVGEAVGAAAGLTVSRIARLIGNAAGGIVGAAVGGIHNGLRWVGEQGPELMDVPAGTTVHSAADSQRMMRQAQGSGGGGGVFSFAKSGNAVLDELAAWVLERLQYTARTDFAGDPGLMFGGGNS